MIVTKMFMEKIYKSPVFLKNTMKRIGGFRRKTRYKLKKSPRQKGKINLTNYFQTFEEGDRVNLVAEPAIQKGMYFPRFHNRAGIIQKKTGSCYEVLIKDQNKEKMVIVHPVHLKRVV